VENRIYPPDQALVNQLTLYLDPELINDEVRPHLEGLPLTSLSDANMLIQLVDGRLSIRQPDGEYNHLPHYSRNVIAAVMGFRVQLTRPADESIFQGIDRATLALEKRAFSKVPLETSLHIKDLWDGFIKKINYVSSTSHTLEALVEKILEIPFLQGFQSSIIVLHLKGRTKAAVVGVSWRSEKVLKLIEVKDFNQFFNSIKKSKIKSFSTDVFPKINLPFNGTFLAKEIVSKKYSLIAIASRQDFLSYPKEEIELYETCVDLLQPHFERLIEQEYSDKKVSELRICSKDFPVPLRVRNSSTGAVFLNDLYAGELQDHDIFFSRKVEGSFHLDLYDSDDLRHYAFDLFHFQRISLLGELLNTLRHELSNPLFGLRLGSQIFRTLGVSDEASEIMHEISKNVLRCQEIMENFSNLYGSEADAKRVALTKIISESVVLAKSEVKGLRKKIDFSPSTQDVHLNVPLIFVVQIIFNLIVNSAQAIRQKPEGNGELQIRVGCSAGEVQIDIIDDGPGIPADKTGNLFKPFFTTKHQGTGLGLLLSRNLALKMGGKLEYLGNGPLNGAHFRLTLPI
jgi:two-component system, NtrC family, sensor kinase